MMRITPRTCFWPLTITLVATFALSIGLTYRSDHHCYAGTCGEWLFPLQARLHVVVWYMWLALSVTALGIRAMQNPVRRLVHTPTRFEVPLIGKTLRLSGLLVIFWIASLYGILIGIWWVRLRDYFEERGVGLPGNTIVAAVALTGHLADVTMGMVLLPVSRNSALASFFKLSPSTTYTFHMVQAYVLFGLVIIHGSLYAGWAAVYNRHPDQFRPVLPVLNPTYRFHEVWPGDQSSLGTWRASLIFTGSLSALIMMAMFFTSFPIIRRKHFNLFYFTHLLAIVAVIVICLHASTMFYCTVPGLSMWIMDWGMRLTELRGKLRSELSSIGNGWYCLTLPLPRARLSGCACHSPLAHFHIHHTDSSIREIHPFTTITHLASKKSSTPDDSASSIDISFLFRKSIPSSKSTPTEPPTSETKPSRRYRKKHIQWTSKVASHVDEEKTRSVTLTLRLEGPYFIPATPGLYETVLCLVAGTGLSGALAIAAAFQASRTYGTQDRETDTRPSTAASSPGIKVERGLGESSSTTPGAACTYQPGAAGAKWKRCLVVWSVRESDYQEMPFVKDLSCPGFEFRTHLTGPGHARLDMHKLLEEVSDGQPTTNVARPNTWVYISGPNGFIEAAEGACRQTAGLEWFAARWD